MKQVLQNVLTTLVCSWSTAARFRAGEVTSLHQTWSKSLHLDKLSMRL